MKPELQRIEATLGQMSAQQFSSNHSLGKSLISHRSSISFDVSAKKTTPASDQTAIAPSASVATVAPGVPDLPSFKPISVHPVQSSSASSSATASAKPVAKTGARANPAACSFRVATPAIAVEPPDPAREIVRPLRIPDFSPKSLDLPKFKLPHFSNRRQVTNPEFAVGLLKEMEGVVTQWQKDLQKVQLQVQDLYLEGPVIDGWLESQPYEPQNSGVATIRHAEIDRLMEYVEEICKNLSPDEKDSPVRTDYRLCGLDADGQLWCRPCPVEKVPHVSLAIARYQKLRQLLAQKHQLESRLDHFAKALIELHGSLQEEGKKDKGKDKK